MAQSTPIGIGGHAYDPETIDLLRAVLDEIWDTLTPEQQGSIPRSQIADRLLKAAAAGERDPDALRASALEGIASTEPPMRKRRAPNGHGAAQA
jgi:hypothetical protein